MKYDVIFDVTAGRYNINKKILWLFVNVFMMDKLSNEDKMRIQTLCEQGLGAKIIRASYPNKNWSLSTLQTICHWVNEMGSAVTRRAGSDRPRSACTAEKIAENHLQRAAVTLKMTSYFKEY